MPSRENQAEVRFDAAGITLFGTVARMTEQGVEVRLQTLPDSRDVFRPGTPANIIVARSASITIGRTRVVSEQNGLLMLAFTQAARHLRARQFSRHPCQTPMTYRAVHADGSAGAWKEVISLDISLGGIGLWIAASVDMPEQVEVRLPLEQSGAEVRTARACADDGSRPYFDSQPIRAMCRVVHTRQQQDGTMCVGLAFTRLTAHDRLRLVRFLGIEP